MYVYIIATKKDTQMNYKTIEAAAAVSSSSKTSFLDDYMSIQTRMNWLHITKHKTENNFYVMVIFLKFKSNALKKAPLSIFIYIKTPPSYLNLTNLHSVDISKGCQSHESYLYT